MIQTAKTFTWKVKVSTPGINSCKIVKKQPTTRSSPGREKETGVEPGRGDGEGGEVSSLVGQDNRP